MKKYTEIFSSFFKIGALTFGGGYAMLPMLEKEAVEKRQWINNEELLDYYAIAQCTPGIIASNTAALIGYQIKGTTGAIIAALGVITPSYIIITIIAACLSELMDINWVQHSMSGIQACVAALILTSIIKLCKNSIADRFTLVIFVLSVLAVVISDISPAFIVIVMALSGIIREKIGRGKKG